MIFVLSHVFYIFEERCFAQAQRPRVSLFVLFLHSLTWAWAWQAVEYNDSDREILYDHDSCPRPMTPACTRQAVYACIYVCMRTYAGMYVCMYVCMYVFMYVCMYVCMNVCRLW